MSWSTGRFAGAIVAYGATATALSAGAAIHAALPSGPRVVIDVAPQVAGAGGAITGFEIAETIDGVAITTGKPVVEIPHVIFNVPTAVDRISGLTARDAAGMVPLVARDVGEGDKALRQWSVARPVNGALTIRYSVAVAEAVAPRGAAPPIDLRAQDGGVSGSGATFLLRPSEGKYRFTVRWDRSKLAKGAQAVSSLDHLSADLLPADTLTASYFMAGKIGRFTGEHGFFGAWQGSPAFDASAAMAWTGRIYQRYQGLFSTPDRAYTVFFRSNPVNAGGGYGLHRAFVATFGVPSPREVDDLKSVLAHEMFHTFQPSIWTPSSTDGSLDSAWFDEGIAVFYQNVLPYRYGLIDQSEYLRGVNTAAGRFYTNVFSDIPNDQVPGRFWEDTRIRTVPYDRGFIYFAGVDAAIRRKSGGRRSLDDLMLALRKQQDGGQALSTRSWASAIGGELGDDAVEQFHAMLAGKVPVPPSDAFGPCFERVQRPLRRYELGFAPKVLTEPRRIVRDLVPGSAAALAGLRDGDEIMAPVGQDRIQGDQQATLTLSIRRDGRSFPVTYTPRGETALAWQWQVRPNAPKTGCALPGR